MHIVYNMINDVEYANISESIREGDKVRKTYKNLGRVLDKERRIFQNRKQGVFTYSIEKGYGKAPVDFVPDVNLSMGKIKLILDFGDSFFTDELLKKNGFDKVIDEIGYGNPDTLRAML